MNEKEAVQRTNRTAIACSTPVGRSFVAGQEASLRACFIIGSRGGVSWLLSQSVHLARESPARWASALVRRSDSTYGRRRDKESNLLDGN